MNRFRQILLTGVFLMTAGVFVAGAEPVSFEAEVNADTVAMGSALKLTLTVHGTQDAEAPTLPAIDGFEARFVGPSTQVRVVNGAYSTAKSFVYMLVPLREGKFMIPTVEIKAAGVVYQSKPVVVEVSAGAPGAQGGGGLDDPEAISRRVMMRVIPPDRELYIGEVGKLLVRLYVRELPVQNISFPDIKPDGFLLSRDEKPRQYQEAIDGKAFDVVEFTFMITPTRSGPLTVGPAVVTGDLLVKNSNTQNPFANTGIDESFFAGFFSGYSRRPMTVTAKPAALQVRDVPAEGRPADFSGGIGRMTFDMTASPLKVKVGDPVTVRLTVAGEGALKAVQMPSISDKKFKVYDPEIREENGQKVMQQVIVPAAADVTQIPAVSFSYFDPSAGQYRTETRGPLALEVLPPDKGNEFQAMAFAGRPVSLVKEALGRDIIFVKDRPGLFSPKFNWVGRNGAPLTALFLIFNLWGILLGLYLYHQRLQSDPVFAGRRVAFRQVRAAFTALRPPLAGGIPPAEFYSRLWQAFAVYLEKKLNLSPGRTEMILFERELGGLGVPEAAIARLRDIYQSAEKARYASGSFASGDMARSLQDMEDLVEIIEKRVK